MFKPGDKVRVLDNQDWDAGPKVGDVGTVTDERASWLSDRWVSVRFDGLTARGAHGEGHGVLSPEHLELATKFRVGDRVSRTYQGWDKVRTSRGTVKAVNARGSGFCYVVAFDKGTWHGDNNFTGEWKESNLRAVSEPSFAPGDKVRIRTGTDIYTVKEPAPDRMVLTDKYGYRTTQYVEDLTLVTETWPLYAYSTLATSLPIVQFEADGPWYHTDGGTSLSKNPTPAEDQAATRLEFINSAIRNLVNGVGPYSKVRYNLNTILGADRIDTVTLKGN